MSHPTFDKESESYQEYQWAIAVISSNNHNGTIAIDTTDYDNVEEEEGDIPTSITEFSIEKKIDDKSSLTMKDEDKEIKIDWDGNRLSAQVFDNDTQDSDKMEVPTAINTVLGVLRNYFENDNKDYNNQLSNPLTNSYLKAQGDDEVSDGEDDHDSEGYYTEGINDGDTLPDDYIENDGEEGGYLPEEEIDIKEDKEWGDG